MRTGEKGRRGREEGMALLYSLMVAFISAALAGTMLQLSMASHSDAKTKRVHTRAKYLAEGAVESAKKSIQTAIANWSTPQLGVPTTVTVDGAPVTYTLSQPVPPWTAADSSGIQTIVNQYEIDATAVLEGFRVTAHRILNAEATPIFQFAVFYTNDLEILPGPNMTLGGRVHSNKDMYLGSNATLTMNTNYVHAVGKIFRNRKDDPSQSPGTVKIRQWVNDPFNAAEPTVYSNLNSKSQMAALGVPTSSGYDDNFTTGYDQNTDGDYTDAGDWLPWALGALEYWNQPNGYTGGTGNTVLTSDHGITEAVTPEVSSISMFDSAPGGSYVFNAGTGTYVPVASGTGTHNKGHYHSQADLTILQMPNGSFSAYDKNGTSVALPSGTVASKQMYDARQAGGTTTKIPLMEIDMAKLNASGKFPTNGLLYAARYGEGTGTAAGGIRLKNGSELAAKLTVVSEDPIFIKGDYNTTAKKGCSVIGDAVNLLSNNWDDSKSKGTLPSATNTAFNLAMISGNTNTSVGSYNGGLENLPRFHENWSGKTCTISGSFVNTWLSQFATGNWVYGADRYTAPNRNWFYDTAFNNIANLPPFTPMVVSAKDVVSW